MHKKIGVYIAARYHYHSFVYHPLDHQSPRQFPVSYDDCVEKVNEVLPVGFVQLTDYASIEDDEAGLPALVLSTHQEVTRVQVTMDEIVDKHLASQGI